MEQEMITKRSDYKVLASASSSSSTWDCCCTQIQNEPSQLELPLGHKFPLNSMILYVWKILHFVSMFRKKLDKHYLSYSYTFT